MYHEVLRDYFNVMFIYHFQQKEWMYKQEATFLFEQGLEPPLTNMDIREFPYQNPIYEVYSRTLGGHSIPSC